MSNATYEQRELCVGAATHEERRQEPAADRHHGHRLRVLAIREPRGARSDGRQQADAVVDPMRP